MTIHHVREEIMTKREDEGTPRPQPTHQDVHKQTNNSLEARSSSPDVLASYAQQAQDERISKELFRRATTSQYRMETERYSFSKIIGRGGMGVVLRGYDKLLSRDVAVKFLNSELNENEEARKIFLTEARLMAKLSHPNLVAVYDVGSIEDKVMMVVELIEGKDLYQMLKASPEGLDQKLILKIGIQLTEVLQYLHEHGMVHRDLKPANVMLKPDETIKLIDFGLTRTMEVLAVRATSVRGTPAYMSPEQLAGAQITSTTDIYQIGATFFELLSGKLPFEMASYSPELRREVPSLQALRPELDADLCQLISDCLAYRSEERPQTAAQVSQRMQHILARLTSHHFEPPTIDLTRHDVDLDTSARDTSGLHAGSHRDSEQEKSRKLVLIGVALLLAILGVGGVIFAMQGAREGAVVNRLATPDIAASSSFVAPIEQAAPAQQEHDAPASDEPKDEAKDEADAVEQEPSTQPEAADTDEPVQAAVEVPPAAAPEEQAPEPQTEPVPEVSKPSPAPRSRKAAARRRKSAAPARPPEAPEAESAAASVVAPNNLEPAPAAREKKSDQPLLFDKKGTQKKSTTTLLPTASGSEEKKPQLYQGN